MSDDSADRQTDGTHAPPAGSRQSATRGSQDSPPDSPLQLLGRTIQDAIYTPKFEIDGLVAVITYVAEDARFRGAAREEFLAAVMACVETSTAGASPRVRERLQMAVRNWATIAYETSGEAGAM